MALQRTPYTPFLLLLGGLLALCAVSLRHLGRADGDRGVRLASLLTGTGAAWVVLFTAQLSSTTLDAKLFWRVLTDAAILCLTVVWLAYVCWYVGRSGWLSWRVFGGLCTVPASLLAFVTVPDARRLLFADAELARLGSFVILDHSYAPPVFAYAAVGYAFLGASLVLLADASIRTRGRFRWQSGALLSLAALPGTAVLVDLSGYAPIPGLDLGPVSVAVTVAAAAIGTTRFEWVDLTPIARDRVFHSMTDAVVVVDTDGRIVDLNPRAEPIVGDAAADAVGERLSERAPVLARALDDGRTNTEVTVDTPDGRRVFDLRRSRVASSVGDRAGHALILRDVTARKAAAERADRRSDRTERLLRVLTDLAAARSVETVFGRAANGGQAVFEADVCRIAVVDDGRLVPVASSDDDPADTASQPVDTGIAGVTHRTGEPVVVDDLADVRGGSSRAAAPAVDADAGAEPTYRSLLSAPVGDRGVVQLLSAGPDEFNDDDRELASLFASHVATAADRAEAESEVRDERDRLDEFAGVVAHDLRNPLTIASGRQELLAADDDVPAEHVEPLGRALDRMDAIIADLLTLARRGDAVGEVERVDLSACAADAWTTVDTDAATLRRDDGLGSVRADRGRLQELFENLFRNAVEHGTTGEAGAGGSAATDAASRTGSDDGTDADPSVTVRVGPLDDADGFYVADDGPGIPESERGAVFEYGHSTTDDGTGIGLAVVDAVAGAHGWEIAVRDAADGGARFEVIVD
jgi:PAS domain S-box-containing protein